MIPVAPLSGDWLQHHVQKRILLLIFEQLRIFVILNAVANGLQANSRGGLRRRDRRRRIEKNSITRPAESSAACRGVDVVPTADRIACRPAVGAIVEKIRLAMRAGQESRLN